MTHKRFTIDDARRIGDDLRVNWDDVNIEELEKGLNAELEHGTIYPETNITNDDEVLTAKIALAHLREFDDYYTRLQDMEVEAEEDLTNE